MSKKDELAIENSILETVRQKVKANEDLNKIRQDMWTNHRGILSTDKETLAAMEKILEVEQKRLATTREIYEMDLKIAGHMNDQLGIAQSKVEIQKQVLKDIKTQHAALLDMEELDADALEVIKQKAIWETKRLSYMIEAEDAASAMTSSTASYLRAMTGISGEWKQTLMGSTAMLAATQGVGAAMIHLADGVGKVMSLGNIAGSTLMKVQEATIGMVHAVDSASAGFAKATGTGYEYRETIFKTYESTSHLAVGMEEAAAANQALFNNLMAFTTLSKETQTQVAGIVASLENLGISSETSAKNIEIMTRTMGMGTVKAAEMQKEMAAAAIEIGISTERMAKDFTSAMTILAAQGSNAMGIFKGLMKQAKATGLSMSQLTKIAGQFDTFDKAAETTGRLNSILGGNYIDALTMVNKNEKERIDILKGVVQQSGRSWMSMSKYEKMAVASAAGITDMVEAARLFGGTAAVHEMLADKADKMGISVEELDKRMRAGKSAMDKLKLAGQQLAVAVVPLVTMMTKAVDWFLQFNKATGNSLGKIVLLASSFALLGKLLFIYVTYTKAAVKWTGLSWLWGKLKTAMNWKQAASEEVLTDQKIKGAGANQIAGQSAAWSAKQMMALGFALLMAGAGIGLAAYGLATLATAMGNMKGNTGPFLIALAMIIGGFIAFIYILATASPAIALVSGTLWGIAAVLLVVGLAVLLITGGFTILFTAMNSLSADKFDKIAGGFAKMIASIASFRAIAAGLAFAAMFSAAAALTVVAAPLVGGAAAAGGAAASISGRRGGTKHKIEISLDTNKMKKQITTMINDILAKRDDKIKK